MTDGTACRRCSSPRPRGWASRPFLWRKQDGAWQSRCLCARSAAAGPPSGARPAGPGRHTRRPGGAGRREPAGMGRSPISRSWRRAASRVPAYTTNTPSDHRHILTHSGAKGVDRLDHGAWPSGCCPPPSRRMSWASSSRSTSCRIAQRIGKRVIAWEEALAVAPAEGTESIDAITRAPDPRAMSPASSTPRAPAARPRG